MQENREKQHIEQPWYEDYMRWIHADLPSWMRESLERMEESELRECFGKHLEFGTGGLRAEIGIGINRMNLYTVRRITQGLAAYLSAQGSAEMERGVAIAYDSRRFSREFAEEAGLVLARNGIRAYVFEDVRPTPILSFAVRYLNASAGIVITASHNPPEYNGYKVYGADGGQLPPAAADAITEYIDFVEDELKVASMSKQEALIRGLFVSIGRKIDIGYYMKTLRLLQQPDLVKSHGVNMKIVYTPLHGTGNRPVRDILAMAGFKEVFTVEEQEHPDPDFPTVESPNPEEEEALRLGIELAEKTGAELVMGTDPDADRIGIAIRDTEGRFVCLTGNQTGAMMLEYLLSQLHGQGKLPSNGTVIKTIVTSELGREIATSYGVETLDVLTGFKYIGEKIAEFERTGEKRFLFGYEESYGYLIGDFVRDKDAVQSALLIAEMAAYYKSVGKTLYEALSEMYAKYGYYQEALHSLSLKGLEGLVRINRITEYMRTHLLTKIGDFQRVKRIRDYAKQEAIDLTIGETYRIDLPKSNVLHYTLDDGCWFAVRPSGTEPKLKIYFGAKGDTRDDAERRLEILKDEVLQLINNIQNHIGLHVTAK